MEGGGGGGGKEVKKKEVLVGSQKRRKKFLSGLENKIREREGKNGGGGGDEKIGRRKFTVMVGKKGTGEEKKLGGKGKKFLV